MVQVNDQSSVNWSTDQEDRQRWSDMSDVNFYNEHLDLRTFDNGKGMSRSGNRRVSQSEFLEYGKKALEQEGVSDPSEEAAVQRASTDLKLILEGQSNSFARYYLSQVLEHKVAATFFAETGADYFYSEYFPQNVQVGFKQLGPDGPCDRYNRFQIDLNNVITLKTSDYDVVQMDAEQVGVCLVSTQVVDPESRPDLGSVSVKSAADLCYPERQTCQPYLSEETSSVRTDLLGADLWQVALDNHWEVREGAAEESNGFAWRFSVLLEYLSLRRPTVF